MNKRDITSSRTPGDIERKYGRTIIKNKKEVESQSKDLASLFLKVDNLKASISAVNTQIEGINELCEGLGTSIENINTDLETLEEKSHTHTNKALLDTLKQQDIDKWNNQFTGEYIQLAQNIQLNQKIEGINDYNLILLKLNGLDRYIPCFKYGNSYKGINVTKDTAVDMEEVSITVQNEMVTNITSTNNILEIIGIF